MPKGNTPDNSFEYTNEQLERLRLIRKETGLNQTDFFKKYLAHIKPSLNAESSMQVFIRDLENGKIQLSFEILKAYTEVASSLSTLPEEYSSIDTLMKCDSDNAISSLLSYRDLCKILLKLDESFDIDMQLDHDFKDGLYKDGIILKILPSGNRNSRYFLFSDSVVNFIDNYQKLKALCRNGVITEKMFIQKVDEALKDIPELTKQDNTEKID